MLDAFFKVEQGRQAALDRASAAGRIAASINETGNNTGQGIFITRRHWEKDNRKRPVKSFKKIGTSNLVEVDPAPNRESDRSINGPLVYRPYQKQKVDRNYNRNKNRPYIISVKPFMTSIYPIYEEPRRTEKRIDTPRGKIKEFSRKSRARLIRRILSLGCLPEIFSTLTYDDTVIESLLFTPENENKSVADILKEKMQADIHRMTSFIKKYYPGVWFYWRVEWKERKHGGFRGWIVPHWHGLWGGPVPFEALKEIVLKKWLEYTGTQNPDAYAVTYRQKSFIKLDGKKHIFFYVSKYTAKEAKNMGFETGRHWGSVGPVPTVNGITIEVDSWEAPHLTRFLRRWLKSRSKKGSVNYIKKTLYRGVNAHIYIDNIDIMTLIELASEFGEVPF